LICIEGRGHLVLLPNLFEPDQLEVGDHADDDGQARARKVQNDEGESH